MKILEESSDFPGMKTIRFFYLTLFGALAVPAASDAQIRDNDASMSVLAVQCAMSSGFSASEYEDYCRRLAKTLSLLSSAQQTRVFGYLPMPGAASLGDEEPVTSGAGSTESGPTAPAESSPQPASAPATTAPSNSLLDMVGRFNSLFDGTGSTGSTTSTPLVSLDAGASVGSTTTTTAAASVLGNTTTVAAATTLPVDSSAAPVAGTNTTSNVGMASTQPTKPSGGWSSLKAWFEAAEAAYKAGTLSSFLKGGN
jgi:hypothetical protein